MVRITKVHTGGGDTGKTSLLDGKRVGKEKKKTACQDVQLVKRE